MAYLSFTFDHRVLDGAGADRFLAAVEAIPGRLLRMIGIAAQVAGKIGLNNRISD